MASSKIDQEDDNDSLSLDSITKDFDAKSTIELGKALVEEQSFKHVAEEVNPLVGPDKPMSHSDVAADVSSGYSYSVPNGTYGEKPKEHIALKEVVNAASSLSIDVPADALHVPAFNILITDTSAPQFTYERDELMELKSSELLPNIWQHQYQEKIIAMFPEICRSAEDLDEAVGENEQRTLVLRAYQEEFAEKGLRGENDIIVLPTGSGKTYVVIAIIRKHISVRANEDRTKIIFFAPTQDLVTQQLKLIKQYLPVDVANKCRAITGDNSLSAEMVDEFIKGKEYLLLVVTPAIIENYFDTTEDASISHFTLLIFDEMHHTKKSHDYNIIVHRYLNALNSGLTPLPQLIGVTATIGIGKKKTREEARNFILDMCAKYNLTSSPWRQELYLMQQPTITERLELVKSRNDEMSQFIKGQLMNTLEEGIAQKMARVTEVHGRDFMSDREFHEDRLSQVYEQHIVSLKSTLTTLPFREELKSHLHYCRLALAHLRECYITLQLTELLTSKSGYLYLEKMTRSPESKGVTAISELFEGNMEELEEAQRTADANRPNEKLLILIAILRELFNNKPGSKVIIFVQRRMVAKYLAEYLSEADELFSAKEFTSIGRSAENAGMNPQQRLDVRAKFEGSKYNILVATSVLEEGIDIQACIMVIRYMYVKDMIAKIQSSGRARHAEGSLVSLLDEKLLEQERDNNFKAGLMMETLQDISSMTEEEFQEQVRNRIPMLLLQRPEVNAYAPVLREVGTDVEICCAMCTSFLGYLKDVRVFQKSHHLIMDATISTRVDFRAQSSSMRDGMKKIGTMLCAHTNSDRKRCGRNVGRVVQMGCGFNFGMWNARGGIVLKVGDVTKEVKHWKDIDEEYMLEKINTNGLREQGLDYQFVYLPEE